MEPFAKEVTPVTIEDEMKQSYLDYAMSVIVGRALPDVRDGLKPVHRRVLYAMRELGLDWNKAYKKSARIVGEVIGKYHPHGESAVYDTIVRMAQAFSLRYVLVDGQGNFGSVDGDPPAAMRYTEVRMARMAHDLLADLDKETVDFVPNYDGSEREPLVLPTRVPNLLVNGAAGIAVGMATNVPPHNLREVVDACLALIEEPDIGISGLITHIPGPDFPTAGIINGAAGIEQAYRTGRGTLQVRARAHVEEDDGKHTIIVTELPYQVNKARLLERIAELVKERKIEGIAELRDESDKDGMRMVIGLRRGEVPEVVLNNLFLHTQMQATFGINMVALVDGRPLLLNIKEVLEAFLRHRREVVTRRTVFELRKARERAHVLEGLAVALTNIDPIIALIRQAKTPADAKQGLVAQAWPPGAVLEMLQRAGAEMSRPEELPAEYGLTDAGYRLSEVQAQAILDLRLQRLTALEQSKIFEEYRDLLDTIAALLGILFRPGRLMEVIRGELQEMREQYGDARRTEIIPVARDFSVEDLINEEDVVVTLSHAGYVKAQPLSLYRAQRRGGKGKSATSVKEEDFVERLLVSSSHDTLLCFSSHGKVYWLKVYELPQGGRTARGRPIVNLLPLEEGESIHALLPLRDDARQKHVFMVTARGTVKKTPVDEFSRPRSSGLIALELRDGDRLVGVDFTDGNRQIMLFSNAGKAVRFQETDVRPMGRTARGVHGMRLGREERVIALIIVDRGHVLTATENGYGKRTPVEEYPLHGRGGQGVISIRTSARNGKVVGAVQVAEDEELMLISDRGTLLRMRAADVSVVGRSTQGVRLVAVERGEKLVGLERVVELERIEEA
jgi:DNA gyrase subunit A